VAAKPAACLAVLGTGSEVGKSVVTAALCRIFSDYGVKVSPFKAQNMSNNSFVTVGGGEIGRAQAVQAQCARAEPSVDMNPLLLKPTGDNRSQVVLLGKVAGEATSSEFRRDRGATFQTTQESLNRLREQHELVIIEGAGSCAEVNLRDFDLANFRTALSCSAPVILVADISKGGVFAQILGTLDLLSTEERAMVKGVVINRFRGDASLFADGVEFIEKKGGVPVLGVIPFFDHISVEHEDSVALDAVTDPEKIVKSGKINIAVVRLPHISNFTDFQPLELEGAVNLSYISRPRPLDGVDLLILPGSKNTRKDLEWLGGKGWDMHINNYVAAGGRVVGICGGYQMLGKSVEDPHGVEGTPGFSFGLGILDVRTIFADEKKLARVTGRTVAGLHEIGGYEIHMGVTATAEGLAPFATICAEGGTEHHDGAVSRDGGIWGSYIHGLFEGAQFRAALLESLNPVIYGQEQPGSAAVPQGKSSRDEQYDLLAEFFARHLDMKKILDLAGMGDRAPALLAK
jgi:adenosylcobyric acid synthase